MENETEDDMESGVMEEVIRKGFTLCTTCVARSGEATCEL